jgi:DNA ligase-1
MGIKRVMKAPSESITDEQLKYIRYPIVGSAKIDGYRCVVDEDGPLTSSHKRFPNHFINDELSDPIYRGMDGELLVGLPNDPNAYNNSSQIMSINGQPDFRFYVFDDFKYGNYTYKERWLERKLQDQGRLVILEQRIIESYEDVIAYEQEMLDQGYEGSMIRTIESLYKEGRCSFRDMSIFKRKPFVECEAVIVGFVEGLQNLNEPQMNETGHMRRSSHQANKVPKGTLGSFELRSPLWSLTFHSGLGEGFTQEDKQEVWNHRNEYLGRVVTVKYQKYGSRNRPRISSVIKIRSKFEL